MEPKPKGQEDRTTEERKAWAALVAADRRAAFGPLFFIQHLRGLVRDQCPDPADGMPGVRLHLADGDTLDLCHIVGISPNWIALAVREPGREEGPMVMRTEFVPYPMVTRVVIRTVTREASHHVGFDVGREPGLFEGSPIEAAMTPEEAVRAVAGAAGSGSAPDPNAAERTDNPRRPSGRLGSTRRGRE
ncbi:MAG: hypothetical protein AABZ94_00945 [Candidatus Eisenbacteria bacterium]